MCHLQLSDHYALVDGVLIEAVGRLWVGFSPLTGETALLNDETVAICEVLAKAPGSTASLAAELRSDSGLSEEHLGRVIEASWPRLVEAGLVRKHPSANCSQR